MVAWFVLVDMNAQFDGHLACYFSVGYLVSEPTYLCRILQVLCLYQSTLPRMLQDQTVNYTSLLAGTRALSVQKVTDEKSHDKEDEEAERKRWLAEKDDEKMKSLVQLYLLKLLAESDVRQVSWMKEVC